MAQWIHDMAEGEDTKPANSLRGQQIAWVRVELLCTLKRFFFGDRGGVHLHLYRGLAVWVEQLCLACFGRGICLSIAGKTKRELTQAPAGFGWLDKRRSDIRYFPLYLCPEPGQTCFI
jgi:hypothetical protein